MLSAKDSRMLALKRQFALFNKDYDMVKKIESVKSNKDITKEILSYKAVAKSKLK